MWALAFYGLKTRVGAMMQRNKRSVQNCAALSAVTGSVHKAFPSSKHSHSTCFSDYTVRLYSSFFRLGEVEGSGVEA